MVFPDGSVALRSVRVPDEASDEEAARIKTAAVRTRVADVRFLADVLLRGGGPGVIAGHLDAARVGVFGHSLGGSTAAEVCRTDARFVAGADLDGFVYTEVRAEGVAQPFLLVESDDEGPPSPESVAREEGMDTFVGALRGPACRFHVLHARHADFTDFAALSPILPYVTATLAKKGGEDTLRGTNEVIAAFFDATVRGDPAGWSRVRAARPRFSYACQRAP